MKEQRLSMHNAFRFGCLLLLCAGWLAASPFARAQSSDTLSSAAEVSMLTVLPGDAVYSTFGHSAFRIHDPSLGIDRVYNYGTFHFESPLFLPKFFYGHLDYFLSVAPYPQALQHYRQEGRPVIEQVLNLSPVQADELFRFLEVNALPENRYYRYDFFFDNCSTRIRDALKATLGDEVQFAPEPDPQETFRRLIDPYGSTYLNLGMDLLLGLPADEVATPWQTMFLPDHLMEAFDHARVTRDGQMQRHEGSAPGVPLVAHTDTVFWIEGYTRQNRAFLSPTLLAWLLFAAGLVATALSYRRGREERRLPDALLLCIVGMAGLLIAFLMFISAHEVARYNLYLLWAWPTHLWAAAALIRGRLKRLLHYYLSAAAVVGAVMALGWPLWPQDLHPALLPIVLLLTLRCGWHAYRLKEERTLERVAS